MTFASSNSITLSLIVASCSVSSTFTFLRLKHLTIKTYENQRVHETV